jgi:cytochrome c oxidase assembly protein subunit 15
MGSKMLTRFLLAARITLVLVYAVIMAGAVVRATDSGMGCPDWPKCFGYYIPPTQIEQLQFSEGKEFRKGSLIIKDEALWEAKHDLKAGKDFNPSDWKAYTKHNYAKFNPAHTWTEYVNRLMGASLGLASFIMLVLSFRIKENGKRDNVLVLLSALAVFLIGFAAWMGKEVVDGNLSPQTITLHMIVAYAILAVVIGIIHRAAVKAGKVRSKVPQLVKMMALLVIVLSLLQTAFGTQVRENVDEISKAMDDQHRELWVEQLGIFFNIHRTFALVIIALNALLVFRISRSIQGVSPVKRKGIVLMALLVLELFAGLILANFGIPAFIQPVHLIIAAIIFGLQCRMWVDMRRRA